LPDPIDRENQRGHNTPTFADVILGFFSSWLQLRPLNQRALDETAGRKISDIIDLLAREGSWSRVGTLSAEKSRRVSASRTDDATKSPGGLGQVPPGDVWNDRRTVSSYSKEWHRLGGSHDGLLWDQLSLSVFVPFFLASEGSPE
jgi:hypothetical protein